MQLNLQDQDTWTKREREKPMNCNVKRGKQQRKTFSNWRKKQKTLVDVCSSLEKDVLKQQRGSQMPPLISKSNALRKWLNEKGGFIAKKVVQLGHIKKCFGAKYSNSQYLQCL